MPSPTREQFDAAAKKVMATAPAGLSREAFYALIDKELTASSAPAAPSGYEMLSHTGRMAGTADDANARQGLEHEPDTWAGGFIRGLRREFVDPLLSSDAAKHAAHPETAADMAGLLLPSAIGMGSASEFIPAAKKLYEGAAKGAADKEGLKKVPAVLKGMWGATKRNPEQVIANYERDLYSKGHVAPDTTSVPDAGIPTGELPTPTPPVEVESAQDALARRTSGPTEAPQQTDRIPLTGDAPPAPEAGQTMNDVLQQALEENLAESRAGAPQTTLPEDRSVGGTQKPKVGKRPGGYTTDLPPITETRQNELLNHFGGRPEAPAVASPVPAKPKLSATEVAEALRREYGSRDGGRMLYGRTENSLPIADQAEALKRIAPGPSRIPLSAERRITEAARKAKGDGGDDLLSILTALLAGGSMAASPMSRQTTPES